jgi:hypothetical protein
MLLHMHFCAIGYSMNNKTTGLNYSSNNSPDTQEKKLLTESDSNPLSWNGEGPFLLTL